MKHLTTLLLILFVNFAFAQSYSVETVPNVKLTTGSYVSNPDNIISGSTVVMIDSILTSLENQSTAQVAVVVLNSIGDNDVFEFSQQLFDTWKIGQAGKDNGLLILFVLDQRTVRFHTGYGIEGILPDARCKDIQREKMVPYFKEGNYDQGLLEGVRTTATLLSDPNAEVFGASSGESLEDIPLIGFTLWILGIWLFIATIVFIVKLAKKSFRKDNANPKVGYSAFGWFFMFIMLPAIVIIAFSLSDQFLVFLTGLYGYFTATSFAKKGLINSVANEWMQKKDYQAAYNAYKDSQGLFSALRFLLPIPFAFLYGSYKRKLDEIRNHPRDCKQCGKPLLKLDEKQDDLFLSKGQLMEETLKSIDYDVWKCNACNAAEKLSYINPSSKYSACPKCRTHAYYEVSDRVIVAATTSSEGTGEEKHACKFCGHQNVRRYTIARKSESSSSSGGSSSGGSWGGGSSGGGGASSSW